MCSTLKGMKMKKNFFMVLALLSLLSLSTNAFASLAQDDALKADLYKIASKNHKALGYNQAKKVLFGQLHLENGSEGYYVKDLYCERHFTKGVGPGNLPDQNQVNCEHTWPQSKFTGSFPTELQKSDLHHLFPTDSKANSTRGNFEFAEVTENQNLSNCETSRSGPSVTSGGKTFFEPPTTHKGNVARAIFYFSVRYKMPVSAAQEEFLKRWNQLDPVDDAEITRNNEIAKLQGNRNPFIDNSALIDQISDF